MIFLILAIISFLNICFLTVIVISQVFNLYRKCNVLNGLKETRVTLCWVTVALWLACIYNLLKDLSHFFIGDAGNLGIIGIITRLVVLFSIIKLFILFRTCDDKGHKKE